MMKKIIAVLLAVALLLGLSGCTALLHKKDSNLPVSQLKPSDVIDDTKPLVAFTVIVVHGDGSEKTFTFETNEKYVGPVLTEAGLLEGNDGPYGLEITVVDGEKAAYSEDGAYWALYEGEEYALQGIDTTPVKANQIYKLVWTKA